MRALILAALFLAALPGAGRGQHFEPPRRAGVELPAAAAAAMHAQSWAPAAVDLSAPPLTGSRALLLIPALFRDSPEPRIGPQEMQRVLFDGPSEEGTLRDFYREASRGAFEVRGHVAPWVRTSVSLLEAAGYSNGHGFIGPRAEDWATEAVQNADALLDYGQFDNDGPDGRPNSGDDDGIVDGLAIQFIEVAGSCGGPGIWPHFRGLRGDDGGPYLTTDARAGGGAIGIRSLIVESATDCGGVRVQSPSVIAHEFGHMIGLPDLYVRVSGILPSQRHWVVGCFDIMAAGAWGCGAGEPPLRFGPSGFSPLMKALKGWLALDTIAAVREVEVRLDPVPASGRALWIPLAPGSHEALIVEYRPPSGFDRWLPSGGILVYHWDAAARSRPVPTGEPPFYPYYLVEADGGQQLRRLDDAGGNRGEASDAFVPAPGRTPLHNGTPGMRLNAGPPSTVTIHSMEIEAGQAVLRISTHPQPALVHAELPTAVGARPYEGRFRIAGGAVPYTVVAAGLPMGLTLELDGDQGRITGTPVALRAPAGGLEIVDARGTRVVLDLDVVVGDPALEEATVLSAFIGGGSPPSSLEAEYLDNAGNRNGRYDLGDARAYLLRARGR